MKFNPDDYETKQIFYTSKDGTRVPMFITARKGVKLDGNNPTLLYGYGGFDISLTPAFSVGNLVWMEMGGIYVQANLRGGGEYGEPWHLAGPKLQKQNVFDDFIAAAEWLIANKYTQPRKAGDQRTQQRRIAGGCVHGSASGSFRRGSAGRGRDGHAALPQIHNWLGVDLGLRIVGRCREFKAIYKYSPLHNLKPGTVYPPTLIVTADHDDRVVPAHSFKFAAALQAAQAGTAPVLIRIEIKQATARGNRSPRRLRRRLTSGASW